MSTVHKTVSGLRSGSANLSIFSLYLTFATLLLFLVGFQHITGRERLMHGSLTCQNLRVCVCIYIPAARAILISISALNPMFINALLQAYIDNMVTMQTSSSQIIITLLGEAHEACRNMFRSYATSRKKSK